MRKLLTLGFVSVLAIPLASCATTGTGVTSACTQWRAISWSAKDTPLTIVDVKASNARRAAYCR